MEILFFSGSSQVDSVNWRLPRATAELADRLFGLHATVLDLADYDLPPRAQAGVEPPPALPLLRDAIARSDGLFIGSDEYTGTYSAVLRNALAWLGGDPELGEGPLRGKLVALCGASVGGVAGLRGQPALQLLLTELGATVVSQRLELGTTSTPFDPAGHLQPKIERQLKTGVLLRLLDAADAAGRFGLSDPAPPPA